jgi:hypothetical protein
LGALKAIAVILTVVISGRFILDGAIRIIARTRVKEAMTATALLAVVGVTLVMEKCALSASLGAFIAGVLLADSDYRHEIEADIAPFEGLLLGLFFGHRHVAQPQADHRQPAADPGDRAWPAGGEERYSLCARPPRGARERARAPPRPRRIAGW